ncbi:MAG TPA: hypothetical protein VGB30_11815 [bacterium]|jgi:hypothetical protein
MRNLLIAVIATILISGCSGSGNPISTEMQPGNKINSESGSSPFLWGIWDVAYDQVSGILQVIPSRSPEMIWNVTNFLQPPVSPNGLGVQILDASNLVSEGRIDVRVTVNHPFPGKKFRGFDVRGVVMGNGSAPFQYDSAITYPGKDELRLENADGYTRWMNATEFTSKGVLGFSPGALGSNFAPTSILNGYKYFADAIEPDESVYDYFSKTLALVTNRGSMPAGTSLSRDYYLRFPTSPLSIKFQYAIIAGWEAPVSGGNSPTPSDFPITANAFEPVALSIADNSTLYYEGPGKSGGNINLSLKVTDWWAYWDFDDLSSQVAKFIVSSPDLSMPDGDTTLVNLADLTPYQTSAANTFGVDVVIPNCVPSGPDDQEIVIGIQMFTYNYSNPFGVPNAASDDALTSYFLYSVPVSPDFNDPPTITSGVTGPASAFVMDTDTFSVNASDPDTVDLTYEWTLRDPLTQKVLKGPVPGDGDGNWNITWATDGTVGVVEVSCTVSDGENIAQAESLTVVVTDIIFHADLNDTTTGDNAGWSTNDASGITKWTSFVGDDSILQGNGYKFGPFNATYQTSSADILVTPEINIPAAVSEAVVVIYHSYEWEYYAPLEVGFDGSNFKITEAPALPAFADDEVDILAGKDYDGWLFDTQITDQMAFASDQYTDQLWLSAFDIPPAFIGSSVHIGFAAATNSTDYTSNRGWLIDDVAVRALPEGGNAPPVAGSPVTGDEVVPDSPDYPGTYTVEGYDLEDDPLTYAWTVRDPDTGDILWGPMEEQKTIDIDWSQIVPPGQYEVHCSVYDEFHPGAPAEPLTVTVQEVIFHSDLNDISSGDNAGWTTKDESGTFWTSDVGTDSFLEGMGYKWGDFNTAYSEMSEGILVTPAITIPSGIKKASVYLRHDFQFLATFDGSNVKVSNAPTLPSFGQDPEYIDSGLGYDSVFAGTVMDTQPMFATGIEGLQVSRMDLSNTHFGQDIYLGFAAASGDFFFSLRGWMIDDLLIAITP